MTFGRGALSGHAGLGGSHGLGLGLGEDLQQKFGRNPKILPDLIELLIEAAKTGNLSIFTNSLANGALGDLARGLNGGQDLGGFFRGGVDFANLKPWSEDDKKFIDQALVSNPQNLQADQISAWQQGQEGNCAAVATIKAAVDRYDNRVFDSIQRTQDGYQVQMQDGKQVSLTDRELSMAKTASNFRGEESPTKAYAQLCYAAMAKRSEMEHHNGVQNFAQSLWSLNHGDDPRHSARALGLQNQMVSLNPYSLNHQDSVVGWSDSHAIFVNLLNNGMHVADHYGTGYGFNGTDTNGWGLIGAFTFKPRAEDQSLSMLRTSTSAGQLDSMKGLDFRPMGADPWGWRAPRDMRG